MRRGIGMWLGVALAGCGGAEAGDEVIDRETLETYSATAPLVLDVTSAKEIVFDQSAGAIDAARVRLRDAAGRLAGLDDILADVRARGFRPEAAEDGLFRMGEDVFREPRMPRGCADVCADARLVRAELCYTDCVEALEAVDRRPQPRTPTPGPSPETDRAPDEGREEAPRDRASGRTNPGGGDRDGGSGRRSGSSGSSRGSDSGGRSDPGDAAGGRTNPGGGDR